MATNKRSTHIWALVVSIVITLIIGFTASLFTRPQIAGWYAGLVKPSFNPPNWLFAPVWTALYIIMGVAAWLVWRKRHSAPGYGAARLAYTLQLVLNFLWSAVFFGLHQILGALVIIVLLTIFIILCISRFSVFSKLAAWLMVPYLAWVAFATLLNFSIYLLN